MLLKTFKRIILRWSMWGQWDVTALEMLGDSVASFRPYFPNATFILSYVQSTVIENRSILPDYLQWHSLPRKTGINSGDELWLKWFPQDITDSAELVFVVDADVFCVAEPHSLKYWIHHESEKEICCMQETNPEPWCYGNFFPHLRTLPHVNAGFVAIRRPAILMHHMMARYQQYSRWAVNLEHKWHDEQGALAEYWLERENAGTASCLPESLNKLLCPSANADIDLIQGLEIIHTPYPDHPKYHELKDQIRAAIYSASLHSCYSER